MSIRWLMKGLALGAGAMYLFDPRAGNRRRAMIRQQAQSQVRKKRDALNVMSRDFSNRTQGMLAETKAKFRGEMPNDPVIVQRVRSEIGRVCSHLGSIQVDSMDGRVTLSGPILASEVPAVLETVGRTRGVRAIENNLEAYDEPMGVSGLQGAGSMPNERWTPATSLAMLGAGAGLTLIGVLKRGLLGNVVGLVGVGVMAKSFADTESRVRSDSGSPTAPEQGASTADRTQASVL